MLMIIMVTMRRSLAMISILTRTKCSQKDTTPSKNLNNHYGGKAVVNAMQFKEMIGISLSAEERKVLERAQALIHGNTKSNQTGDTKSNHELASYY
jgi:hypothetical protein